MIALISLHQAPLRFVSLFSPRGREILISCFITQNGSTQTSTPPRKKTPKKCSLNARLEEEETRTENDLIITHYFLGEQASSSGTDENDLIRAPVHLKVMLLVLFYATFQVSLCLFPSEADGCVWKLFLLEVITPLIFFSFFSERHPRNSKNQPQHRLCEFPSVWPRC